MPDPKASEAARELSRARWGASRANRLADELATRADEIDPERAARLRERLDERAEVDRGPAR
jgi:hypothetical protein